MCTHPTSLQLTSSVHVPLELLQVKLNAFRVKLSATQRFLQLGTLSFKRFTFAQYALRFVGEQARVASNMLRIPVCCSATRAARSLLCRVNLSYKEFQHGDHRGARDALDVANSRNLRLSKQQIFECPLLHSFGELSRLCHLNHVSTAASRGELFSANEKSARKKILFNLAERSLLGSRKRKRMLALELLLVEIDATKLTSEILVRHVVVEFA
jgi:hypothetical protein